MSDAGGEHALRDSILRIQREAEDAIRGGVQDIWTLGVNWYLNPNVKIVLNWLRVDVDRLNPAGAGTLAPFGPEPGTPPLGVNIGQELNIYGLRTQYSF